MIKVAVVGCGLVSRKKHLPAFNRLRGKAKVVAVCDMNEDLARQAAAEFNVPKTYNDLSKMLLEEKPDVVDICTPPQTHLKLAIESMGKGSHILLEKPMALRSSDCDAIIETASKYKKEICVVHNQIFNPAFMKAKELVSRGEIGDFTGLQVFLVTPTDYMTSIKDHWAHRLPGGVLGETGPHAAYLALSFLKNIRDVGIHARKILHEYPWANFEDFRIVLVGENGIGSITLIYSSNQWAATVDIIGTRGILKVDLETRSLIKYDRPKLAPASLGVSLLGTATQMLGALAKNGLNYFCDKGIDAHTIGIQKFMDSLLDSKPSPVTAYEGKETIRLMEMIVNKLEEKYKAG